MQIGQYIASNGGVVAAEELAPYLDIESSEGLKVVYLFKKNVFLFLIRSGQESLVQQKCPIN